MAEAAAIVGLVASIASLVELSAKVVSRLDEFTSKTLEIPEWFRSLSSGLPLLTATLQRIQTQAKASRLPDNITNVLKAVVDNTSEQVSAVQTCLVKILPPNGSSKLERASKALKSLAKEDKVQQALEKIHKNIVILLLCQTTQHIDTGDRVLEELSKLSVAPPVSAKSLGLYLGQASQIAPDAFIGRINELQQLQDWPSPKIYPNRQRIVSIVGMGGMGKIQPSLGHVCDCADECDTSESLESASKSADADFAVGCVIENSVTGDSEVQLLSRTSCACSDLKGLIDHIEHTHKSMTQISDTIELLVHKPQGASVSEDSSILHELARVFQDRGGTNLQIKRLGSVIEQLAKARKDRLKIYSDGDLNASRGADFDSKWHLADDSELSATNVFFDCSSRFSLADGNFAAPIDRASMSFSETLDCRFESNAHSYPEQYTLEGCFNEWMFALAVMLSREDHRTVKYFLTYAETPRRWQRVIVYITFHEVSERSNILQVAIPDSRGTIFLLPSAVQTLLRTLLPCIELNKSVTKLCVSLREDAEGDFIVNSDEIKVTEDDLEVQNSNEKRLLEDIDAMNCPKFVESEVVVQWRIQTSRYKAYIKSEPSQPCVERKVPFASAGRPGENAYQDFLDDIKFHIALRDCKSIVKFMGIVLDDNRRCLKSYLFELPMLMSLETALGVANSRSETIPWSIREAWMRQIIKAIVNVHSKGIIFGALDLNWVGVRADGTVVLVLLTGSDTHIQNRFGVMPPELRDHPQSDKLAVQKKAMNFRTDVFSLGLILWLIMEHKPNTMGYFCAKAVCMHYPRYTCKADHSNPVELPECCGSRSQYLREIIRKCRSQDSHARTSALELAEAIESTEDPQNHKSDIGNLLRAYATATDSPTVYCDECGDLTTENHFHCNVCEEGDFDICPGCYARGIRCYGSGHLVHRIFRNRRFIDAS